MLVRVGLADCVSLEVGSYGEITALPRRVRQLGVTTTEHVELDLPLSLEGTTPEGRNAPCPPG